MIQLLISIPTGLCLMGMTALAVSHFFTSKQWSPIIAGLALSILLVSIQIVGWDRQGYIYSFDIFGGICLYGIIVPSFIGALFLIPWRSRVCSWIAKTIAFGTIGVALIGILYFFIAPPFTIVRWLDIEYRV